MDKIVKTWHFMNDYRVSKKLYYKIRSLLLYYLFSYVLYVQQLSIEFAKSLLLISFAIKIVILILSKLFYRYEDTRHTDYVRGLAYDKVSKNLVSCGWDKQVHSHTLEAWHSLIASVPPYFQSMAYDSNMH